MAGCADHAVYSPECRAFRGLLQWHAKNLMGCSWQSRPAGCCEGRGVLPAGKGRGHGERPPSSTGGGAIGVEWALERDHPPFGQECPPPNRGRSRAFPTARDYARLRIPTQCARRGHAARHGTCVPSQSHKTGWCKEINTSWKSRWGWC